LLLLLQTGHYYRWDNSGVVVSTATTAAMLEVYYVVAV